MPDDIEITWTRLAQDRDKHFRAGDWSAWAIDDGELFETLVRDQALRGQPLIRLLVERDMREEIERARVL